MCSLPKNFHDFQYLIQLNNIDVTDISESRIIKNKQSIVDMNLPDYSYEFYLTEPSSGDNLPFIGNYLSYKLRNDLNIYKSSELESPFTEISNAKKNDTVIRCICKHPNMNLNESNQFYLNDLLGNLSKENKAVFLLGDFNIIHLFLGHIPQPIRVRVTPKLL